MKKILAVIFFINLSAFSQWSFNSSKNDFDGNYKLAYVIGSGGEYPYNNPYLKVSKYEESTKVNIYISDAGYSGCDNLFLYFKFDEDNTIYVSSEVVSGVSNEAWFLKSIDKIEIFELLEKFKKHKTVSVRVGSGCGFNDYKFSLNGASKSINYVVGEEYFKFERERKINRQKRYEEYSKEVDSLNLIKKEKERKKNSLFRERTIKRYTYYLSVMDNFKEDKFEFYESFYKGVLFYQNYPIIFGNTYKVEKPTFFVVDTSFKIEDFEKVVFIEEKGAVQFYLNSIFDKRKIERKTIDEYLRNNDK